MSGEVSRYYLLGSGRFADAGAIPPIGASWYIGSVNHRVTEPDRYGCVGRLRSDWPLRAVQRSRKEAWVLRRAARGLLLNLLTEVKIPYGNIAAAENARFTQGPIGQWVGNAVVAWNHLFGGDFPRVGTRGEINTSVLVIRLKKYAWSFLPPFIIPRKSLRLMVDGAELLKTELQNRLLPTAPADSV